MFWFYAKVLFTRFHIDSVRLNFIFLSVQLRRGINSSLPSQSTQSRKGGGSRVDLSSPFLQVDKLSHEYSLAVRHYKLGCVDVLISLNQVKRSPTLGRAKGICQLVESEW